MTIIENRWRDLATAVIERAIYDVKNQAKKKNVPPNDAKSAKRFLNNSRELEFYADIAGRRNDMVNAGFLNPME